jgi:hypothetical protein
MPTFANDFAFGTTQEKKMHSVLEGHFNKKLNYRGGSASFDYDDGATFYVELKSRTINHDDYPTTLIGANKVAICEANPTREYWFCWNYRDGLYGIKYSKEKFATYECKPYSRGARSDYHNKPQLCYFIPITDLIRLS